MCSLLPRHPAGARRRPPPAPPAHRPPAAPRRRPAAPGPAWCRSPVPPDSVDGTCSRRAAPTGPAGHRAAPGCEPGGPVADPREGARQGLAVGVLRVLEDRGGGALLHDPARVHHREPVTGVREHRQVVADHDQTEVLLGHQLLDQPQDLSLDHHIESRRRLVRDDQVRVAGQRHRDHHTLPLTAGELVRIRVRARGRQPHVLQEFTGLLLRTGRSRLLVQQDRLGDLVTDAVHGVERVHRPLEDDRGTRPAHGPDLAPLHGEDVLAVQQDLAGDLRPGGQQPQQRERERRLAAPGLTGDAELPARVDGEVHAPDRLRSAGVRHREVAYLQQRGPLCARCTQRATPSLGLRTDSMARPHSVNDSATRAMAMPGGARYHQSPALTAPASRAS